jgi:glycosyltransferase involved in cell wall biosynthesis
MNGMVVPPESPEALADAIYELLNDPDKRSKMGELARATVESNFNGEESAKQLCALFTS